MPDLAAFHSQFPQLKEGYHYLDSAASSLTPQIVLDEVDNYYRNARANIHRGLYKESVWASELYENARMKVAQHIGAHADEVIFTSGATASANMLMRMLEDSQLLKQKKSIVSTVMEHHSALVPLQQLAKRTGLTIDYIGLKQTQLDLARLDKLMSKDTAVVSALLASNVLGVVNPISQIASAARANGALMLVAATAALGHIPVDVRTLGADAIWFSGHKMISPTGVGILWVKKDLLEMLPPTMFGGDMVERVTLTEAFWSPIPERFEAGTPHIAGAIGMGAAVEFIELVGIENIHQYNQSLLAYAEDTIGTIPGVTIVSHRNRTENVGTLAFTVSGVHPHDLAQILAGAGVAIRAGHHCAMPLHTLLGVPATARASFHLYNTELDVDVLKQGIEKAKSVFI
jgi:cysteine desulfurase/selenocysteine lyase